MTEKLNNEKCALEGCFTIDFLPITCTSCSKRFCTMHAATGNHNCPSESLSLSKSTQGVVENTRIPCSFSGCITPTLFYVDADKPPQSCPACGGVFCLTHRHAAQHNCTKVAVSSSSSKSQALAQRAIANTKSSSSSSSKDGSKNRILTPKMKAVELMKMRRKAEAANPRDNSADIPMDQRFFVVVAYGSIEKILWVQNNVVTGKALDLFASKLGALSSTLTLKSAGGEPLQMSLPLASQLENPARLFIEKITR